MNKKLKFIALAAAVTCTVAGFAGCGGKDDAASADTSSNKITYWVSLSGNESQTTTSRSETPFGKALAEKTGVEIEYQHPAQGQAGEEGLQVDVGEFFGHGGILLVLRIGLQHFAGSGIIVNTVETVHGKLEGIFRIRCLENFRPMLQGLRFTVVFFLDRSIQLFLMVLFHLCNLCYEFRFLLF